MLRRFSVPISIVVHAIALGLIVFLPLLAGNILPGPVTRLVFAAPAALQPPEPPPPLRAASPADTPRPDPRVAPVEAPSGISKEPPDLPAPAWQIAGVDGGVPAAGVRGIAIDEPPPAPAPVKALEPLRVGGRIREPRKIKDAVAVYPPIALAARVSGTVVLDAIIGEDGHVRDVTVRTSLPLLNRAAIDAVRQWEFTPTTLNGVAVPVILTVRVTFTLRRP